MKINIKKLKLLPNQQSGFILPVLLITGVAIVLMITAVASESVTNHTVASHGNFALHAQMAADAGLDDAMNKINTVSNWTGTGGQTTLLNDAATNVKTTYEVSVADGADTAHKTLTVTARAFSPTTATTPKVTRKYDMDIQAVTSGNGPTSVSSGVGGLILNANAKISGGDVVVNGKVTMSNNSQIGLSTNAVNVRVAHQSCPNPANSTYPQVCGAGNGEPISMGNTAKIYGNVQAKNQTTGTNMFNPGLVTCASTNCDPVTLPSFDRTGFKNTVNASGQTLTAAQASTCSGGIVNWPANVKITGNVSTPNNCTVKINGNVWITGSLTPGNNGKLTVQNGVGATMPDVVVDGSGGLTLSNNATVITNSSGTGIEFLTFWSAASCSPDCSSVTGTDLFSSQNTQTINLANNGAAPGSILYAYWSKVTVSNNGAIGAVAGQTVQLSNNAVINFTSSVPGSDNRVTTWVKRGYMRVYN
jgi:Tfp pilus assembly protein PilX